MGGVFNNVYDKGTKPHKPLVPVELSGQENHAIILPTVLRVTSEEINYWTNMTCFYDKQWMFNPKLSTAPLCFFHIVSMRELTVAQVAEKRVIVYQAPQGSGGISGSRTQSPAYRPNLEVVTDNIVVQPKQYQMEVIIPDTLIGPFIEQGIARLSAMVEFMGRVDFVSSGAESKIESGMRLMQVLGAMETGSTQIATLNKNSIEAMIGSGHVLCFKNWTGYNYSYGVLTNLDISKKPTEKGVFRGSLTFQETPVLNISQADTSKKLRGVSESVSYNPIQIAGYVLALPFMKLTGVVDEAGAPGTSTNEKTGWLDLPMFKMF
jgi:hypothetical protein